MNAIGDVVVIHIDDKPSVYARIEAIETDAKPRWFQVKLLFLSFPPQEITWILRREYLEGSPFTMNDIPIRISPLKAPVTKTTSKPGKNISPGAEVISISSIREKKDRNEP